MNQVIDKLAWTLILDRKILYVRSKGKELFFNPGGKREEGESNEQALTREIKEELRVDLTPGTFIYDGVFTAQAAGKPEGVMVEIKCYQAKFNGTLTPQSEIEELAWFNSNDMDRTSATGQLILKHYKVSGLID